MSQYGNFSDQPYAPPQSDASFASPNPFQSEISTAIKHSGPGIASFVISLIGGISMIGLFVAAGIAEASTPGGLDEDSTTAMMVGLGLFGIGALLLIGFTLGLVGVLIPNRKKLFAILGLLFNSAVIAGAVGLVILGVMMSA